MTVILTPELNISLVLISWIISFLGASVTSQLLCQSHVVRRLKEKLLWLGVASTVFGFSSIWSLHFCSMMAQRWPVGISYSVPLTVLSAAIAVVATFCAFSANLLTKYFRRELRKHLRQSVDSKKVTSQKPQETPPLSEREQQPLLQDSDQPLSIEENRTQSFLADQSQFHLTVESAFLVEEDGDVSDDEAAETIERRKLNQESALEAGDALQRPRTMRRAGSSGTATPDSRAPLFGEVEDTKLGKQYGDGGSKNSSLSRRSSSSSPGDNLSSISTGTYDSDPETPNSSRKSSSGGTALELSSALKRSIKRERRQVDLLQELKANYHYAKTSQIVWFRAAIWAVAICAMHYLGMIAIRVEQGHITFSPALVVLSYVVAFVVCLVASIYIRDMESRLSRQLTFSFLAATGVFLMHWTGSTAATFHSDAPQNEDARSSVPESMLMSIVLLSVFTSATSSLLLSQVTSSSRNHILETVLTKRRMWRLIASKEAAEAANSLKSDFISVASHELRTPLHTVSGYSDLLLRTTMNDEQLLYLTNIRKAVHTIQLITRQVLDFSKMEKNAGDTDAKYSELNLRDAVHGVAEFSEDRPVDSNSVSLLIYFSPEVPQIVMMDETYFTRIVMNLLSNALKFTSEGFILISITVSSGQLLVEVEDTGIGIRKEFIKHLFDPFSQADQSFTRAHTGTGLGMAITSQLTKRLGGKIEVESKVKEGTRFLIYLPLQLPDVPQPVLKTDPFESDSVVLPEFESTKAQPTKAHAKGVEVVQKSDVVMRICEDHTRTQKRVIELWKALDMEMKAYQRNEHDVSELIDSDYVWVSARWAEKHVDLLPSILLQPESHSTGSQPAARTEAPRPIVCFMYNDIADFAISPLLLTSINMLRFKRPLEFHKAMAILSDPLPHLTIPTLPEKLKLVRFASTPAPGAPETEDVAIDRERERVLFQAALEASRGAQEIVSEPLLRMASMERNADEEAIFAEPKTILLVEDNAINSRLGARILQKLGYQAVLATNGKEATELILVTKCDGVLMDCHMPIMNGFDATRSIRAMEAAGQLPGHIPIIALTANVTSESELECRKAGMDAFMSKPLLIKELEAKLKETIK